MFRRRERARRTRLRSRVLENEYRYAGYDTAKTQTAHPLIKDTADSRRLMSIHSSGTRIELDNVMADWDNGSRDDGPARAIYPDVMSSGSIRHDEAS